MSIHGLRVLHGRSLDFLTWSGGGALASPSWAGRLRREPDPGAQSDASAREHPRPAAAPGCAGRGWTSASWLRTSWSAAARRPWSTPVSRAARTRSAGCSDSAGPGWAGVRHVVLTHKHPDHAGSVDDVLARAERAVGYVGAADLGDVDGTARLRPLADGDDVFGLRVVATPGPHPGHIAVFDTATRVLVAGDALNNTDGLAGSNPQFTEDEGAAARPRCAGSPTLKPRTILVGHGDPSCTGRRRRPGASSPPRWPDPTTGSRSPSCPRGTPPFTYWCQTSAHVQRALPGKHRERRRRRAPRRAVRRRPAGGAVRGVRRRAAVRVRDRATRDRGVRRPLPRPRALLAALQPARARAGRGHPTCRCWSGCASSRSSPATSTSSSWCAWPASSAGSRPGSPSGRRPG